MRLKYKCTVELDMAFPDFVENEEKNKTVCRAREAIDQIIDQTIHDGVFDVTCAEGDYVTVTRESLEYVDENAHEDSCEDMDSSENVCEQMEIEGFNEQ